MQTRDYGWTEETKESSGYINPAILRIARATGAKTILDAGCGNGRLVGDLAAAGFETTGVDADAEGIRIAESLYPNATFHIASFSDVPPGQYDFVCSTEVVEHLYSPHELAQYCFDALVPGGTLAISTPYHGYLKNLVLSVFHKWDLHLDPHWHGGHIKFWSRRTLTRLLEAAGFEVTDFVGVGRVPYLWKSMILIAHKPG